MMNTLCDYGCRVAFIAMTLAPAVLSGCNDKDEREKRRGNEAPTRSVTASVLGPDTSAVAVDMSKGWCAPHGVAEYLCTLGS